MRAVAAVLVVSVAPACDLVFPVGGAPGSPAAQAVSTGRGAQHCSIDLAGALWCWGLNLSGQVGDGTPDLVRTAPVVIDAGETWLEVATGARHTCAIRTDATLWCWGDGGSGQLGDGRQAPSPRPIAVGDAGWAHVAAGDAHTCGIRDDGSAWCWGDNAEGQLGDGTMNPSVAPRPVDASGAPGTSWTAIATGRNHTCAIRDTGTLWCWGWGVYGQLGGGLGATSSLPVQVGGAVGSTGWTSVAAGYLHTCGIDAGQAYCWGSGGDGELGDGQTGDQAAPVAVTDVDGTAWTQIALGSWHACGVRVDGSLWCWGWNGYGAIGDGDDSDDVNKVVPVRIGVERSWSYVGAGDRHTCAIADDGAIWCAGENGFGTLGDGMGGPRATPVQVPALTGATAITVGARHTCATLANSVHCWGSNGYGKLGDLSYLDRKLPVMVAPHAPLVVAAGFDHTCEVRGDQTTWCWGDNTYGQLGDGGSMVGPTPVRVSGGELATTVDASLHTCSIDQGARTVRCWGFNTSGQVGDGTTNTAWVPLTPQDLGEAVAVTAGGNFTCALAPINGSIACWGYNFDGELGNGTNVDSTTATLVASAGPWLDVEAGQYHACARATADLSLSCWGLGSSGQLGGGSTASANTPMRLDGRWLRVSAGSEHTCAIADDGGSLSCWGNGAWGKLGLGTSANVSAPMKVDSESWLAIGTGAHHTCGIRSGGTVWCWGNNGNGEIGDGSAWRSSLRPIP